MYVGDDKDAGRLKGGGTSIQPSRDGGMQGSVVGEDSRLDRADGDDNR